MRLIDADTVINKMRGCFIDNIEENIAVQIINSAPSIEPKRGEWIESGFEEMKCSVCGSFWDYCDNDCERFNFCPDCGADMREVRDEGL